MANTSKCNINKLQVVQNFACRIVSDARKYDHITPIRKEKKTRTIDPDGLNIREETY